MKFLPLLALAALTALTGCETKYTRFTSSDYEGTVTSEWIAEGTTHKVDQGYRIKAVERSTYGTDPVTIHYPNGWRALVTGPNILFETVPKPHWLAEMDGEVAAEERTPATSASSTTTKQPRVNKIVRPENKPAAIDKERFLHNSAGRPEGD